MLFKSFHLRNLKRALKQDHLAVQPNTYDTVDFASRPQDFSAVPDKKKACRHSFRKIENFEDVPDHVLIKILICLDSNDISRIRLVNRRLNNIVQRHHDSFSKTVFESIGLVRLPLGHTDKITITSVRHNSEDSLTIALSPQQLDSAMRHIHVTDHLSVENLPLTRFNCHMLQRSITNKLGALELIGCRLEIGFKEFARLVSRWRVCDLSLFGCYLDDAQIIGDDLFRHCPQISGFS
uniref:F-box domain-containing protein n=1 Tax=Steinernema glaseri TaxID=37863 RepID=A0A1I7Z9L4_9BILA